MGTLKGRKRVVDSLRCVYQPSWPGSDAFFLVSAI